MRKNTFCFISLYLIIGCAQIQSITTTEPPQTMRNEKCFESQKLKVFQVLDDGIMAHICPTEFSSIYDNAFDACIIKGDLVYMPVKSDENDFVDEQKIELSENECFGSDGTYSYNTREDIKKTIRKIKVINSQRSNPAYEEAKKKQP